jgi:ABC-type Zn uptake system ZnuABC Zn-binding protein ZnuA
MKQIVEKVRASEVPSLFVETSVDRRSMERLSKEVDLPIYSDLFTDQQTMKGLPMHVPFRRFVSFVLVFPDFLY